ncbi:MAG: M3 family metallopeptidase [Bacteroidales bacterium]|nr:M3 family metallopeptidase [Bacteroidales bacterium]
MPVAPINTTPADNPLLRTDLSTPHQTPPFSELHIEHFAPALDELMAQAQAEVERIAAQSEAPSFDNTLRALEESTLQLDQCTALLFNLNECNTNTDLQQLTETYAPLLERFELSTFTNEQLFERVHQLHDHAATDLDEEQQRLLHKYYSRFERSGIGLRGEERQEFIANAEELAALSQQFNRNVLNDTNAFTLHITDEAALSGLPTDARTTAADEARKRGLDGWLLTLDFPCYNAVLTYADNRPLREQMWRAYNSRGNHPGQHNNDTIAKRIAHLRQQQATLLGRETYVHYVLENRMATTPMQLSDFYTRLLAAAMPAARRELQCIEAFAQADGLSTPLQRWDFAYYAERHKQQHFHFDTEELRPYFQLDKVREGIFTLYRERYGMHFTPAPDIELYHPDASAYEVMCDGRFLGVLYLDMHPRASKRGGAWMTEFRMQYHDGEHDVRPFIQVVCNFTKPTADHDALLSFGEVETFMHEMGHAVHGLLSQVRYPSLSCTNVERDFVEMPSQLMENWCTEPSFLQTFACHYKNGSPLPTDLIDKIIESRNYLAGWYFVRQLSLGLIDLAFHTAPPADDISCATFEQQHTMELLPMVEGCCTSTSFTHIFAGGYAAGYYSYKWAEVLEADLFEHIKAQGLDNKECAHHFRDKVLSRGGSRPAADLFRDFMGRDPDPDALLRRCGLTSEQQHDA